MNVDGEAKPKVLIVEDEEPLANVYQEFLGERFDTVTVHSGAEALATVDDSVDIVLLDRRMPGTSGDEVLRSLQAQDFAGQVVMATAAYPDFDIVEVGFDNYIVKPIDREDLLGVVEQTLVQATYEDELRTYYEVDSHRARLEATMEPAELEDSENYREVTARLDRIRDRIDDLLEQFEGPGFAATVERTQTMAVLRESEERFRSMTEDVLDTSEVGTVIVDADGRIEWVTATMAEYFDLDRETVLRREYSSVIRDSLGPAFADGEALEDRLLTALERNDGTVEFQCLVRPVGQSDERWLKHWSKPIEHGLFAGGRIEHYYDITVLKQREETLAALHDATRRLIDAETADEIGRRAVDVGIDIFEAAAAAVYLRGEDSGELRPGAYRTTAAETTEPEAVSPGQGVLWEALIEGETREITGSTGAIPFPDLPAGIVVPMGNHGVLVLAYPSADAMPTATRTFTEILGANTEVTLDRAARERTLLERDEALEWRNEQLSRLNRINTAIRSISQALIDASTRAEIEEAVCERLNRLDSIRFVWIGVADAVDETLNPTAWAGDEQGYLDVVLADFDGDGAGGVPALAVAESRTPTVVDNLIDDGSGGRWRSEALNRGFQSVAAIPLVYEESLFGVLELYADRPTVFGGDERDVLAELGETIGHGINAINRRDALMADDLIELEFAIDQNEEFFFSVVGTDVGAIELKAVIPQSDGDYIAFFVISGGTADAVADAAEAAPEVTDLHLVRETEDERLWKCRVTGPTVVTKAADIGTIPISVRAGSEGYRLIVLVPQSTDIRGVQRQLSDRGLKIELVARRDRATEDNNVREALNERIDHSLTDRQREALQSAYFSGYFDWPREASGREVAQALAIDQSTFQEHLRAGQRHVFESLFDSL